MMETIENRLVHPGILVRADAHLQNLKTEFRNDGVDHTAKEFLDRRVVGKVLVEETNVEGFGRNERIHKTKYGGGDVRYVNRTTASRATIEKFRSGMLGTHVEEQAGLLERFPKQLCSTA